MTSSRGVARVVAALLAIVFCAGLVTACSGPAVIVRVAHSRGETQVPMGVDRIVVLGRQWIDTASALGVQPVGYLDDFSTIAGQPAPWPVDVPDTATVLDPGGDLPGQIAALKPDLILASSYATSEDEYETLAAIAPTLPNLNTIGADAWTAQLDILGKIVGEQALAQKLEDDVLGQVNALARKYPNLEGETYLQVFVDSPSTLSILASPDDAPLRLLGMTGTEQFERTMEKSYSIPLPQSRIKELDADVLIILGTADLQQKFRESPDYESLLAVKRDTILFLEPVTALAFNRASVLSMPYLLTQFDPILGRADAFAAPLATNSPAVQTTEPER